MTTFSGSLSACFKVAYFASTPALIAFGETSQQLNLQYEETVCDLQREHPKDKAVFFKKILVTQWFPMSFRNWPT